MPVGIEIEFSRLLDAAVGPVHGLAKAEIIAYADRISDLVQRIEKERSGGKHRYRELPTDGNVLKSVNAACKRYRGKFDNLVVLGIGGSALGNIALQTALNPPYYNLLPPAKRGGPRLFVMDNVDPVQFDNLLTALGPALKKTLFNIISKSGETAETAAQFLIVRDLLARKLGAKQFKKNMLVTTDPSSGTMREIVNAEGYDTLDVPAGVGGRFTVLAAVGLFSAAMCGINIAKLRAGAADMGVRIASPNWKKNPAALLAAVLHAFYVRGKRLHVMMPYSYQLKDMSDWYRQLWAESLGKRVDLDGNEVLLGPTPIKALGATDQHSQVQLYREGPNDKVFMFLEVAKFDADVKIPRGKNTHAALKYLEGASLAKLLSAEKRATEYALGASQRPCLTIRFPRIDEYNVGQFIMLWQAATTLAGGLFHIDPYDQPAVELGKQMTFGLMGKRGFESQAKELAKFEKRSGRETV